MECYINPADSGAEKSHAKCETQPGSPGGTLGTAPQQNNTASDKMGKGKMPNGAKPKTAIAPARKAIK